MKDLRGFLGLTGYYRRFVKDYGKVAKPLIDRLRKNQFSWDDKAEQAFQQLKLKMISLPTLTLPDFDKLFVVEADASGKGIGAVLMQDHRAIAYYSHAFN